MLSTSTQVVQFYRNFREFTGGHLKHWHYFHHTFYANRYVPYIFFGAETVWHDRNPWRNFHTYQVAATQPLLHPDVLFVEGVSDWPVVLELYPDRATIPVINLIQHVRHADPNDPRYQFLPHRAIRICVSEAVYEALAATKRVNGPLIKIPYGLDLTELPSTLPSEQKTSEICIAALKNPELGIRLRHLLIQRHNQVQLLADRMPRSSFLTALNRAKLCVFLPWQEEGFYLPALEGMALNTLVICPDCIGNRMFCLDGENCFRPEYQLDLIVAAIDRALHLSEGEWQTILRRGRETVAQHSLLTERRSFLSLLDNLDQVW